MKALNLYSRQDVRYEETIQPDIENDDDVLIKVQVAGICGSDISRFGKLGSYNPGLTWGHEFSGEVVKTGPAVKEVKNGDRVTACNCFPVFNANIANKGAIRSASISTFSGDIKTALLRNILWCRRVMFYFCLRPWILRRQALLNLPA